MSIKVTTQVSTLISLDTRADLEALDAVVCMSEMIPDQEYVRRGLNKMKIEKIMGHLHEQLKSTLRF